METDFIIYEGVVVPESAMRRAERSGRWMIRDGSSGSSVVLEREE